MKKRKSKNTFNRATKNILTFVFFIIIIALFILYYKPIHDLNISKKEFQKKQMELENEKESAQEIRAKLAYLNTPAGIRHIAKLNGFVEPGEVVIQLTDNPNFIIEKPKKNILGKEKKLACDEHTIKGKPHYNNDCVVCQKINKIYEKSKDK